MSTPVENIVAPELLIQQALQAGFNLIVNTPSMITSLFQGYSPNIIQDVTNFLTKRTVAGKSPVYIAVNYPKTPISYPHIAVVLGKSSEDPEHDMLDDAAELDADPSDSNSTELHAVADNDTYNVLILSEDPNLTLYLWIVAKAILMLNRVEFTRRGMQNILLGGNDVALDPEQFPQFAYARMLTVSCLTYFRVPEVVAIPVVSALVGHTQDLQGDELDLKG